MKAPPALEVLNILFLLGLLLFVYIITIELSDNKFQILCLEGSVISFISPSSGGSTCTQWWPETPFISFIYLINIYKHKFPAISEHV